MWFGFHKCGRDYLGFGLDIVVTQGANQWMDKVGDHASPWVSDPCVGDTDGKAASYIL